MARLGTEPLFQFLDSSENILVGGKIHTYETGASTTAQATYADAGLTIKNPNPVILDSRGSAIIYMETDTQYRFVIKDSLDTTLYTVDNILPILSGTKLYDNLDVNGNSIVSASNGDITVTPNGSGKITLDGVTWATADGSSPEILKTDGSGNASFKSPIEIIDDTTPQLGADLDCNSFDIQFDSGTGIRDDSDNEQLIFNTTTTAGNYIEITNAATGNSPSMQGVGDGTNVGLGIYPKGTGSVSIDSLVLPDDDNTSGSVLITDGASNWSLSSTVLDTVKAGPSDMESASSIVLAATPLETNRHPGIVKAYVYYEAGADVILDSYNIASSSSTGSSETFVFTTPLSTATYCALFSRKGTASALYVANPSTTQFTIVGNDANHFSVVIFGDHS